MAKDTNGAILEIFQFMTGKTPDPVTYNAEVKLITDIENAPGTSGGAANGWVAIGSSLADSKFAPVFTANYQNLSDTDFINKVFADIFGSAATDANRAALSKNLDIFTSYYKNAPDATDPTGAIRGKGAFIGDLLHQASDINTGQFAKAAAIFEAAGPNAKFGAPLFDQGVAGSTSTFTTGADNFTGTSSDDLFRDPTGNRFTSTDSVHGGDGKDILQAQFNAGAPTTVKPVMDGVEAEFITNKSGAGITFDMGLTKDLKVFWDSGSNGAGARDLLTNVQTDGAGHVSTDVGFQNETGNNLIAVSLVPGSGVSNSLNVHLDSAGGQYDATGNITGFSTQFLNTSGVSTEVMDLAHAPGNGIVPASTLPFNGSFLSLETGDKSLTNVVIKGEGVFGEFFGANALTSVTSIDASGLSPQAGVHSGAFNGLIMFDSPTHLSSVIGGSGADFLQLVAQTNVSITGGGGADSINMGTGKATAIYTSGTDSTLLGADTLTNFTTAVDKIDVSALHVTGPHLAIVTIANPVGDIAGLFSSKGSEVLKDAAGDLIIDANSDGNFSAATDLVIKLAAQPVSINDILF
jgi:hypothetical protein